MQISTAKGSKKWIAIASFGILLLISPCSAEALLYQPEKRGIVSAEQKFATSGTEDGRSLRNLPTDNSNGILMISSYDASKNEISTSPYAKPMLNEDKYENNFSIATNGGGTIKDIAPPGKLLIKILAISTDEATVSVIQKYLSSKDIVNGFNTSKLKLFPRQTHMLNEASIKDIRTAIKEDILQSGIRIDYILYNPEKWDRTPMKEQKYIAYYINKAADIVHHAGYKYAVAPMRTDLIDALYSINWEKVDFLNMQLQRVRNYTEFNSIAEKVSTFVKGQNPNIIVTVQVNPTLYDNTIEEIINSIKGIRNYIDGVSIVWGGSDAHGVLEKLLILLRQM